MSTSPHKKYVRASLAPHLDDAVRVHVRKSRTSISAFMHDAVIEKLARSAAASASAVPAAPLDEPPALLAVRSPAATRHHAAAIAFATCALALAVAPASLLAQDAAPLADSRATRTRTFIVPAVSPAEITPITQQEFNRGFQQFRGHVLAILRSDPTADIESVYHEQRVITGHYKLQARYRATFHSDIPQATEQRVTLTTPAPARHAETPDVSHAAEQHVTHGGNNSATAFSTAPASTAPTNFKDTFTIPKNPPTPPSDASLKPVPELPPTNWHSAK
jgi:hypothetical protein